MLQSMYPRGCSLCNFSDYLPQDMEQSGHEADDLKALFGRPQVIQIHEIDVIFNHGNSLFFLQFTFKKIKNYEGSRILSL